MIETYLVQVEAHDGTDEHYQLVHDGAVVPGVKFSPEAVYAIADSVDYESDSSYRGLNAMITDHNGLDLVFNDKGKLVPHLEYAIPPETGPERIDGVMGQPGTRLAEELDLNALAFKYPVGSFNGEVFAANYPKQMYSLGRLGTNGIFEPVVTVIRTSED